MNRVSIVIPGTAKSPQQRKHGIGRRKDGTAFLMRYGDDKANEHRNTVRAIAAQAMGCRKPFEGPVMVRFQVFVRVPKSMTKRDQALVRAGRLFPCKTPDLDGSMKLIFDGLNQCVVVDDKQIVRLAPDSGRFYGRWERIEVDVWPVVECALQAAEFMQDAFAPVPAVAGDLFGDAA